MNKLTGNWLTDENRIFDRRCGRHLGRLPRAGGEVDKQAEAEATEKALDSLLAHGVVEDMKREDATQFKSLTTRWEKGLEDGGLCSGREPRPSQRRQPPHPAPPSSGTHFGALARPALHVGMLTAVSSVRALVPVGAWVADPKGGGTRRTESSGQQLPRECRPSSDLSRCPLPTHG